MKKRLLALVLTILMVSMIIVNVQARQYDYDITAYDIIIDVNEDNTYDITERISAYFNVGGKHGIYRDIPLRNNVVREDGTSERNRAKVEDISCNTTFTKEYMKDFMRIKIGDADRTVSGAVDYTISYRYELSNDQSNEFDELYMNLIGAGWESTISNVTFTINMPKEFDSEKLGFTYGNSGAVNNEGVNYTIEGNSIKGSLYDVLNAYEAFTVRMELPEGYFVKKIDKLDIGMLICTVMAVVLAIISAALWYKYGRDDEVVQTVEFYPPDGLNSAELGYIYKGQAEKGDIVSLVVYLANKGYLRIDECQSGFMFTKIKEYDGSNEAERIFFEGLFKSTDRVTKSDLKDIFYTTIESVSNEIEKCKYVIFNKVSSRKGIFIWGALIITATAINIIPMYSYYGDITNAVMLIFF